MAILRPGAIVPPAGTRTGSNLLAGIGNALSRAGFRGGPTVGPPNVPTPRIPTRTGGRFMRGRNSSRY